MTTISLEATGVPVSSVSVPTSYLIFQKRNGAFWPLRVGRTPGGAALPVFGSPEAARQYLLAERLGPGWQVRITSNGELASILSGVCQGVETVVLDPRPEGPPGGCTSEIPRKRFLDLLLRNRSPLEPAPVSML